MNEPIDKTFTIDNLHMEQDSKRVVDAILGINSAGEQLLKTLRERITTQKDIISRLEKDFAKLERKSPSLKSGPESEALKAQLLEAKQLLQGEKKALADLESQLNILTESISQLVSIRKVLSAKMAQMQSTGEESSVPYKEMTRLAKETEKILRELNITMNHIGGNLS